MSPGPARSPGRPPQVNRLNVTAPAFARLAVSLALASVSPLVMAGRVPPGFEDIANGQTEHLDIRLFNRSAGLSPVHVTLEHIRLEAPQEVMAALGLPEEAQRALLPALSQPLSRNSHLACRHAGQRQGCGYLDPPREADAVSALYDEGEGVVYLFLARQWIASHTAPSRFHRVSEQSQNAFLHQQMLNMSGGRGYQSVSAQGDGVVGMGSRSHVSTRWNLSYQRYYGRVVHALQFDNAFFRHDVDQRHYVQLGRMDRRNLSSPAGGTFSFSMLPLDRFQGARVGTTHAYVAADAMAEATPLTVLLARDARVDAFIGDRLLQTFYLQGGINLLDTRAFPFGTYSVTLRIYEDGVLVRSEEAPFDKGADWAGQGVQWFLQTGWRDERERDHTAGAGATMMGLRLPVGRKASWAAGGLDVAGVRYAEMRLDLRLPLAAQEMRASFTALRGSDGSHGQQQQVSYRQRASWNLYRQRTRGMACHSGDALDGLGCADALSASVAVPLAGGSAYLAYTRRQAWHTGNDGASRMDDPLGIPTMGPPTSLRVPAGRSAQHDATWQASYGRAHRWNAFGVSSRVGVWRKQTRGVVLDRRDRGVYFSVSVTRLQRGERLHAQRRHGMDVRQSSHQRPEINYSTSQSLRQDHQGGYREASAELRASNGAHVSGVLGARVQNRSGYSGISFSHSRRAGRSEPAYALNHSSGLAISAHGLYWGGAHGAQAGVAAEVGGSDDLDLGELAAEVSVGGMQAQRLRVGERRLLPLSAYQAYQAEVQDASAQDNGASVRVKGGEGARPLFLAPGRLLPLSIPIEVTYTFIGTVQDIAGGPIADAPILNAAVPGTSASGGFAIEFARRETALYVLHGDRLLHCPLRVRERRSVLLLVGAVQCTPLAVAQLPADIRQQPRVTRLLQEQALIANTAQKEPLADRQ